MAESCSRQLRGWADSLQNTDIAGQRHLNDRSRESYAKRKAGEKGRQSFAERERALVSSLPANHPARLQWERKHGPVSGM